MHKSREPYFLKVTLVTEVTACVYTACCCYQLKILTGNTGNIIAVVTTRYLSKYSRGNRFYLYKTRVLPALPLLHISGIDSRAKCLQSGGHVLKEQPCE